MQTKFFYFTVAASANWALAQTETGVENVSDAVSAISNVSGIDEQDERAVRNCNQDKLPALGEGLEWSCTGNSCGISCPSRNQFYKNQIFCTEKLRWKVTAEIPIEDISCRKLPKKSRFEPACDIDTAPVAGENGTDRSWWDCDKRYRRCKLNCDESTDHKAKTQIICDPSSKTWSLKGKNSCTPPVPRTCDHSEAEALFNGQGELTCERGKSCVLKCNNHIIQGALTCKQGEWVKKNEDMSCCNNDDKPIILNGDWACKIKKFFSVCKLQCTNGKKARTMLKCENNDWVMNGEGQC